MSVQKAHQVLGKVGNTQIHHEPQSTYQFTPFLTSIDIHIFIFCRIEYTPTNLKYNIDSKYDKQQKQKKKKKEKDADE